MTDKPAPTRDSASVLIVRDGDIHPQYGSLQILMVKRHANIKFAGGAYVFPGGKLDPADRDLEEEGLKLSGEEVPENFRGLRYAALREVFEETGLLIGTHGGQAIDEARRREFEGQYRSAFLEGSITLKDFLDQSGVNLDLKGCRPFAHWITPIEYPRRFDTRFFLCVAPEGQLPSPDGHEITAVEWMYPLKMVKESDGDLMFPTMMNLKKLGQAKTVEEALKLLADRDIVTVTPEVITGVKNKFRTIPEAAGYDDVDQTRTRTAIDLDKG